MNLGDIITRLEAANPQQVVKHGFHNPHSYRGDYYDLAFEPATAITVAEMLEAARSAVGTTYQGWKGGDFKMNAYDWCWLSEEGTASGETISPLLLEFMLTPPVDRAAVLGEAADVYAKLLADMGEATAQDPRYWTGVQHVVTGLRSLAKEAQQQACDHSFPDPFPDSLDRIGNCRHCDVSYQAAKAQRLADEGQPEIEHRDDCSACRHTGADRD